MFDKYPQTAKLLYRACLIYLSRKLINRNIIMSARFETPYLFSNCLDFELSINADLDSLPILPKYTYSKLLFATILILIHHVIPHSILVKYKIFSISTFFKHLTRHFPILFADTSVKFLFQKRKEKRKFIVSFLVAAISKKKGEAARTFDELSRALNNYPNSA